MIAPRNCPVPAVLLTVLLAACAHRPAAETCIEPARDIRYCLLPPSAMNVDGYPRLVHVVTPDVDRHFVAQIGRNDAGLVFAASSLLGQPLFEMRYDARGGVNVVPHDAPVRARWLLAMLQFATAGVAAVNRALDGAQMHETGRTRIISREGRTLVSIEYDTRRTRISLPGQDMHIDITVLSDDTP